MKIDRLLELTREMYPTEYSDAVLLMWLSQCESSILTEINLLAVSDCTELQQVTDAELSAPHPYDKLYLPYMQAMICQANGETDKYVNHMQIYNTFRDEYARWVCAVIAPAYGAAKKEGYYLSAYALARERGFAGTVDDWLESLKGLQGEKGDKGDRGDPGEAVLPVAVGAAGAQAGVHYEAFGEDLPDLEVGRQIVLIPMATNVAEEIYLALNDGADHPIRLRAAEAGEDADGSRSVPVGALVQNIPYTLTFAGDCWLIDTIPGTDLPLGFVDAMKYIQEEDICGIPVLDNMSEAARYIYMHIVRSLEEKSDTGVLQVPSMKHLDELLDAVYKRIDGINVTSADGLFIYFGKTVPEDAPAGSIVIDLSGQDAAGVSKEMLEAIVAEALSEGVQDIVKKEVKDAIPDALPNPFALTFTGAVEGSYDGSKPLTLNIPMGGGNGAEGKLLKSITLEKDTSFIKEDLGATFNKVWVTFENLWCVEGTGTGVAVSVNGNDTGNTQFCASAGSFINNSSYPSKGVAVIDKYSDFCAVCSIVGRNTGTNATGSGVQPLTVDMSNGIYSVMFSLTGYGSRTMNKGAVIEIWGC